MRRRLWIALVSIAALALVADAAGLRGRTIESTRSPVLGLGLEQGRLFWTTASCTNTYTRPLAGGRAVLLGNAASQDCNFDARPDVAYARGRALWSAEGSGNSVYEDVTVGAPGERPKVLEQVVGSSAGGDGDYLSGAAGGGSTLVYAVVSVGMLDTCTDPGTPCDHFIESSRTMRVVGRRAVRVSGVPPAVRLAAGGGRIAVDVAGDHDGRKLVRAGTIEVRDAVSGRRLRPGQARRKRARARALRRGAGGARPQRRAQGGRARMRPGVGGCSAGRRYTGTRTGSPSRGHGSSSSPDGRSARSVPGSSPSRRHLRLRLRSTDRGSSGRRPPAAAAASCSACARP